MQEKLQVAGHAESAKNSEQSNSRGIARRLLLLFIAATLVFIRIWLLLGNGTQQYFLRRSPFYSVVLPLLVAEVVVIAAAGALFTILDRRRISSAWRDRSTVVGCFVVLIYALMGTMGYLRDIGTVDAFPQSALIAIAIIVMVLFVAAMLRPNPTVRLMEHTGWAVSPVIAVILLRAFWFALVPGPAAYKDLKPGLASTSTSVPHRVVLLIFDEMSQQVVFGNRPAGLSVPNLDALREHSVYATAAYSPSNATSTAMPAITTGLPVASITSSGTLHARLHFASAPAADWASLQTVFDDARQVGGNVGIVGWYHPYGRVLATKATSVAWCPAQMSIEIVPGSEESATLPEAAGTLLIQQVLKFPGLRKYARAARNEWIKEQRIQCLTSLFEKALNLTGDPSYSLVFLHLPVPHPPSIYDRSRGVYKASGPSTYLDNVALADQFVGRLRRTLESAKLDAATSLVLLSDHSWRTSIWRTHEDWTDLDNPIADNVDEFNVPFLVSLPGAHVAVTYNRPISTLATRGLVQRILTGEISTEDQVTAYLSSFNSPPRAVSK